ncbi:DUF4132 domain-containing protein [Herbidospora galbida]|uniref:DUF4132 domain-containing protein n=1 Tax=Herbidospora galbida TaxID=2575442 RepID=A0A4U3MP03_9ACTN|nr:DUF4132 domain-containing protein [Herbidospora galbida]TKK90800.1 DUF4132 domain-containing protein [Herbidospora galbida]
MISMAMAPYGRFLTSDEWQRTGVYTGFDEGRAPETAEEWRLYGHWAQLQLGLGAAGEHDERVLELVRSVAERDIEWTLEDFRMLLYRAGSLADSGLTRYEELFRIPLAAAARFGYQDRRELLHSYTSLGRTPRNPRPWEARALAIEAALAPQVEALTTEPAEHGPAGAVRNEIWDCDPFARMLAEDYGHRLVEVMPLLRHWNTARSTKPSARWLKTAASLLTPEATELVRELLTRLAAYRERRLDQHYGEMEWTDTVFLKERTIVPLRGLIWTCQVIEDRWVNSLLTNVGLTCATGSNGMGSTCRCEPLANAIVGVLSRRGGPAAIVPLARIQAKARSRSVQNNLTKALAAVADETGLTREQLLDRTVPTFGLDTHGVREERIDGHLVRLTVDGPALSYVNAAGKPVKSAPQAIRKDPALADLKIVVKEIRQAQTAERFRLEQALVHEREWPWHEVVEYFLDHPLTGAYARTLVWRAEQGPAGLPVRTGTGWALTTPGGERHEPTTPVRLWHPIHATADEVRAWRDHLLETGVRQPFKQVFRELYLLTPAEEATATYSTRFAGHVLRYGQAKTLLVDRGWTGLAIGHWSSSGDGDQGAATRELAGWRASWDMHLASSWEADNGGTASLCATGRITFSADVRQIPPLVLSELLRECDLAVGVASVGRDAQALGGHEAYWHSYGFGELTESAATRRDVLTRLLPKLRIADRADLTDRFLRVRGDLRTYKIHLGSGNILMEPNDAYLCIVPGADRDRVFLPFEEDGGMLSVILSKALLLADDTAITDPTITRQINAA